MWPLALFLLLFANICYSQTTFYISTKGNDNNSGLSQRNAWKTLKTFSPGNTYLFNQGDTFYFSIPYCYNPAVTKMVISSYGIGNKPILSLYTTVKATAWQGAGQNIWKVNLRTRSNFSGNSTPNSNPGFLKIDDVIYGNKMDKLLLSQQWDFYADSTYLYVYSPTSPSLTNSFKVSSFGNIVNLSSGLEISNLKIMGTGSHGVQGAYLKNVKIKNLDITEIGGSYLPGFGDGNVRYGNGVEFWNEAENCVVENCRIEEVYDAALTMQGIGERVKFTNTIFRNNILNKNEQSFEVWAKEGAIGFTNCSFVNNRCYNAGYGWSHEVRPYKSSAVHILTYPWEVSQAELTIENNTFYRAKSGLYFHNINQALPAFHSKNNRIALAPSTPVRALFDNVTIEAASSFVSTTGFEQHSVFALANPDTLPPNIESFTATRKQASTVVLNWKTLKGFPDKSIQVERSLSDTNSFVKLASLATPKAAITKPTSFIDNQVGNEVCYYRLRYNDIDGHRNYSKILRVNAFDSLNKQDSRGNAGPGDGNEAFGLVQLNLYNYLGQRVVTKTLKMSSGLFQRELNNSSLPRGIYIMEGRKNKDLVFLKMVFKN